MQNVIERSVIVCDSEEFVIDEGWLSHQPYDSQVVLPNALAAHERKIIVEALRACDGRVFGPAGAATRLGIFRARRSNRKSVRWESTKADFGIGLKPLQAAAFKRRGRERWSAHPKFSWPVVVQKVDQHRSVDP
jgi:hypothetical protein